MRPTSSHISDIHFTPPGFLLEDYVGLRYDRIPASWMEIGFKHATLHPEKSCGPILESHGIECLLFHADSINFASRSNQLRATAICSLPKALLQLVFADAPKIRKHRHGRTANFGRQRLTTLTTENEGDSRHMSRGVAHQFCCWREGWCIGMASGRW